jgi:acyl dehydratase
MTRDVALEELNLLVGRDLGASAWIEVTQQRINEFAQATGDYQWMHTDIPRAMRERGGTIAHGLLILSLLPLLSDELLRVTGCSHGFSYGYDHVRFSNPVRSGSRIRLHQKLLSIEPKKDGLLVKVSCMMEIENEPRPALVAENLSIYYKGASA